MTLYNGWTESEEATADRRERKKSEYYIWLANDHRGYTRAYYDALMVPPVAETEQEMEGEDTDE